jgi:urate oxidase
LNLSGALSENSYGKSSVRVTKVLRHQDRHEAIEYAVDIALEGDFAESYTAGDNRKLVATDSMKNTVYVLAKEKSFDSPEGFAVEVARHFCTTYEQVKTTTVSVKQSLWQRIELGGKPHPHAFVAGAGDRRIARARLVKPANRPELAGGIEGLQVLKTTASEFRDFVTDRYRTLKDTRDRIFATTVDAEWEYTAAAVAGGKTNFNEIYSSARRAILETFATHHSLAVQQTLLAMGQAVLDACSGIESIKLTMPNQHRIPFDLTPFGLKNENDIFVTTSEPFGLISGVVRRS